MLHIDLPFVNRLSPYLENFKQKSQYLWNFSCPICGDVSKGKKKMRGYAYRPGNANHLNIKCHHCGYSSSLGSFLKLQFPSLYKEYVYTRYQETSKSHVAHKDITEVFATQKVPMQIVDSNLDGLKECDALSDTHPVAKFLSKRMIPQDKWCHLYYTTHFKEYTNSLIPGKIKDEVEEHPRLIIPYLDNHGKMFAYVARAFGNEEPRYYTIKLDERERVFGLDRLDYSANKVYAVEGAIDSLFLPNCIAVSGSSFDNEVIRSLKSVVTLVFDNEPRSREITKLVHKHIKLGYKVCMLPHKITTKDINEHVLSGMTPEDVLELIDENTFQGPEALLKFSSWKLV
jgi:hypothetical protein